MTQLLSDPRTSEAAPASKVCTKCCQDKPLDGFNLLKHGKHGRQSWCKRCMRDYQLSQQGKATLRAWRDQNKDHFRYLQRKSRLKTKYGITEAGYMELFEAQNGKCAICGDPPRHQLGFCVDHDHETGGVRGLLCNRCNPGIAMLRHDRSLLEAAITYLEGHGSR